VEGYGLQSKSSCRMRSKTIRRKSIQQLEADFFSSNPSDLNHSFYVVRGKAKYNKAQALKSVAAKRFAVLYGISLLALAAQLA
jgi:hypothetical protein